MSYTYDYPRAGLTVDIVLFSPDRSHILCVQRSKEPFRSCWALPGGFANIDETLEQAAIRELKEETNIEVDFLEFMNIYDSINRDPRGRTISCCFRGQLKDYRMPTAGDDAAKAEWVMIDRILNGEVILAFDHKEMVELSYKGHETIIL